MIAYKKSSMKAVVACAALMSMPAVRAMDSSFPQCVGGVALGGILGAIGGALVKEARKSAFVRENPVIAGALGAAAYLALRTKRQDVVRTLRLGDGASTLAELSAWGVGLSIVLVDYESKGSNPEKPQGGIEVLPGKSGKMDHGLYY